MDVRWRVCGPLINRGTDVSTPLGHGPADDLRSPRCAGSTDQRVRVGFTEPMGVISDRPAEAQDRAMPGHREGDRATRSRTSLSGLHAVTGIARQRRGRLTQVRLFNDRATDRFCNSEPSRGTDPGPL